MMPKLNLKQKIMYILRSQAFIPFPSSPFSPPPTTGNFVFDLVFNFKKYSQCLLFVVLVFYKVLQTPNK